MPGRDGSRASRLLAWIDDRLPISSFWRRHFSAYYVPKNLNFWYFFGVLALLVLAIEVLSGIFLAMHYKPVATLNPSGVPFAFASIDRIMLEVPWGWLIRNVHAVGASALFLVLYLHIFASILYGSYRKPRELVWIIGMAIFLITMAEAFFGRLLPWGQAAYWGTTVIFNLLAGIPLIGADLALWLRGGLAVGDATLGRFYILHLLVVPLALLFLAMTHVAALRQVGLNNPDGVEIGSRLDDQGVPLDGLPYHPYFTVKDLLAVVLFLLLFVGVVFFVPEGGGYLLEYGNLSPADPLTTSAHVRPPWYFAPFFCILRSVVWNFFWIDAHLWGGLAMLAAILVPASLPWLDHSPVRSVRYRGPITKILLGLLVFVFVLLGIVGAMPNSPMLDLLARICTFYYFAFFLSMPWWSRLDRYRLPPERLVMK
ncbi:MAG: cytochrome b subunit of the bc complex [Proteobacteria bacterium]|nr:cytochrome b subunit of the bc complex [Pseudomonadota bacterium]